MIGVEIFTVILPDGKKVQRAIRDAGSNIKYVMYKKEPWIVTRISYSYYALSHKATIY